MLPAGVGAKNACNPENSWRATIASRCPGKLGSVLMRAGAHAAGRCGREKRVQPGKFVARHNCEQVSRQAWERFDASRCTCCRQVWLLLDQPRRQVGSDGWRWGIWRRGPCGGSAQNFHGRDGVWWVAQEKLLVWKARSPSALPCEVSVRVMPCGAEATCGVSLGCWERIC